MANLNSFLAPVPEDWRLDIIYKPIRHIYFKVYPGQKTIRVSAPVHASRDMIAKAIRSKSGWLLKKINTPVRQITPVSRMQSSQSCYLWGQAYALVYETEQGRPCVQLSPKESILVRTRPGASMDKKTEVLNQWLRKCLNAEVQGLLEKLESRMGVSAAEVRIRKMKTRWGSCNTRVGRVWLNAALVRLDPLLLEYVMVHELAHLIEPSHNNRFYSILDRFLPDWKTLKSRLDGFDLRS